MMSSSSVWRLLQPEEEPEEEEARNEAEEEEEEEDYDWDGPTTSQEVDRDAFDGSLFKNIARE